MDGAHLLDNPVWHALEQGWSRYAMGNAKALRLDPEFGPFAACVDRSSEARAALRDFDEGGEIYLVEPEDVAPPPGMTTVMSGTLTQMVAEAPSPIAADLDWVDLGDGDAPAMRALTALTKPGPFAARTHEIGGFIGVKESGRLLAMAGERMQMGRFVEVSGVCTLPAMRGRGLAGALMSVVMARIVARGKTPILHSYSDNKGAIALYERLGFVSRRQLMLTVLAHERAGNNRLASP